MAGETNHEDRVHRWRSEVERLQALPASGDAEPNPNVAPTFAQLEDYPNRLRTSLKWSKG